PAAGIAVLRGPEGRRVERAAIGERAEDSADGAPADVLLAVAVEIDILDGLPVHRALGPAAGVAVLRGPEGRRVERAAIGERAEDSTDGAPADVLLAVAVDIDIPDGLPVVGVAAPAA